MDLYGTADWKTEKHVPVIEVAEVIKSGEKTPVTVSVGKEIAHLTYSRLDVVSDEKPWPFVDIAKDMIKVFDVFLGNVVKDNMHISWSQYYSIRNKYYL